MIRILRTCLSRLGGAAVPALLLVTAVCEPCYGEVYQYTDTQGDIHITDDPSIASEAQNVQRKRTTGEEDKRIQLTKPASTAPDTVGKGAAPSSSTESKPEAPAQKNEADDNANILGSSVSTNRSGAPKLPPQYEEQFKDVIASSQIPATDASCAEFKKGLSADMDKIFQTIRELAEKKKKGTLGVLDYGKGIWMLKSVGWVVFRHETGPEQCVKEFDKENERRFEAESKEIDALTKEVQEKNAP